MTNDDDNTSSNNSGNRSMQDILSTDLGRRRILQGSLASVATGFFAVSSPAQAWTWGRGHGRGGGWGWQPKRIDFTPVAVADGSGPVPAISAEYDYEIILPWGDPLEPNGPAWSWPPNPADQARQIGIGHDGMWFFPLENEDRRSRYGWNHYHDMNPWKRHGNAFGQGNDHGVLCMNNEYGSNSHVLGKSMPTSLADVRTSQHAHGVTIVEIRKRYGRHSSWETVNSDLSRRIHVNTPVDFSGPVADHSLLHNPNGNIPLGTVNNCAHGYTPWGTYLTCEENFHGYFGTQDSGWSPSERQARYGISNRSGYGWYLFDRRFDIADPDYVNEVNRFGWVVEIDPMDPTHTPVKRTALGRIKHEGSTVHVDHSGRVVVYMGDDQANDYIYKFVSEDNWQRMRDEGRSPLDHGTLYVARFNDDGSGDWLELSMNVPVLSGEFTDLGELLINTRTAADLVGATPMDRPEWITVDNEDRVYCALTNNSGRSTPNAANPLAPNPDGHIVRWTETDSFVGQRFQWDIFLIAENTHGTEESFSDPDGLWADPDGRLFIQTDGGQKDGLNNQMLVADTDTGEVSRLFTGVTGCEITGLTVTPDRRTMFVNVQHPGNGNPSQTNFPVLNNTPDGVTIPRDATIVITRRDGGVIGS